MEQKAPQWDRHMILAALRRKGMTLTHLAKMNGRSPSGFRAVWARANETNERIIAEFLEEPVEQLFPERYPKKTTSVLAREYSEVA